VKRLNNAFSWPRKAYRGMTPGEATGTPNMHSSPVVPATSRVAMPNRVLFPAPLGPTSPQIRPAGSLNEQS
jgi:hypothetical protein